MSDPRVVRLIQITEFADHTFSVREDRGRGSTVREEPNTDRDGVYDFVEEALYGEVVTDRRDFSVDPEPYPHLPPAERREAIREANASG